MPGQSSNNVCGLVDLVELLGEYRIRNFVFSSSATVYGSKADLGMRGVYVTDQLGGGYTRWPAAWGEFAKAVSRC